jgi:hypothetical protein
MEKRMKTSKLILSSIVFSFLFNGCVSIVEPIVPDKTEQPEFTATEDVSENTSTPSIPAETATPTEESIVDTPTLTIVPTETLVPTPTLVMGVESEIDPYIVREIEGEYKGIKIKARIIIDRSLEYMVESFEVRNESYYVQVLAEILGKVWYIIEYQDRDPHAHYVTIRQTGQYFPLWQKAQETGNESDWRKVQLNDIWANDLNDGNGYIQKPYNFWPMYEGEVPEGVKAFNRITVVIINQSNSDITNLRRSTKTGAATHIDGNDLVIYSGVDYYNVTNDEVSRSRYSVEYLEKWFLIFSFADFDNYLIGNIGNDSPYISPAVESSHLAKIKYGFDITFK